MIAELPPAPTPLPELESTDLDALGERIATLSAQLDAAGYELLVLIRRFDERGGWGCGFRSCAHWLNWRTGLDLGAAREKVRVARALADLPLLSAAMRHGQISFSKVRALTRIATPATEEELLAFARSGTAAHVERLVRLTRRVSDLADAEKEGCRHESRHLDLYTDEDGMVVVRGRLAPEAGAALGRALDAAAAKLYGSQPMPSRAAEPAVPVAQRRADALGLVAESALAGGLDPGTRGDRYQVVLHVEVEAARAHEGSSCRPHEAEGDVSAETSSRLEPGGLHLPPREAGDVSAETSDAVWITGELDGARVSAETCRRIACDCAVVEMAHDREGSVLDVGRRRRTIPPALRRALERRDRGCRFPGCGLRLCDGHHVEHWADGGETRLDNLVLLCRRHHRAVHEEGFRVELGRGGEVRFAWPDGRPMPDAPATRLPAGEPSATIAGRLGERGIAVGPEDSLPSWNGTPVEYGVMVEWLMARHATAPEPA
jgi:hypothetical protein